jgi:hypothetical protein
LDLLGDPYVVQASAGEKIWGLTKDVFCGWWNFDFCIESVDMTFGSVMKNNF